MMMMMMMIQLLSFRVDALSRQQGVLLDTQKGNRNRPIIMCFSLGMDGYLFIVHVLLCIMYAEMREKKEWRAGGGEDRTHLQCFLRLLHAPYEYMYVCVYAFFILITFIFS